MSLEEAHGNLLSENISIKVWGKKIYPTTIVNTLKKHLVRNFEKPLKHEKKFSIWKYFFLASSGILEVNRSPHSFFNASYHPEIKMAHHNTHKINIFHRKQSV